ncbi:MAG: ABC transporter permease [Bacteroidota bacterium]|nr:ABC transporter permease [Bacteroidota bacterium]
MLKNYFKTALRSLSKNGKYSLINIVGLAASLAVSILLLLWVRDELSFDRFNTNASRIYKLAVKFDDKNIWNKTPAPAAVYAKEDVPEVEDACRIKDNYEVSELKYKGKRLTVQGSCFADASLFKMFTFPLIEGRSQHPFTDAHSIVISETTAKKFFGNEDPMGKVLQGDDKKLYRITGVMKDMPENSTLQYCIVFNFQELEQDYDTSGSFKTLNTNWDQYSYDTYVLLKPKASATVAAKKLSFIHRHDYNIEANQHLTYLFDPLTKLHLYSMEGKDQGMMVVHMFFIIAVIVLSIACINYVNLITARAINRGKEIGIRKIIGAGRTELFMQFMSESFLTFLLALILATGFIYFVMPFYNFISGKNIVFKPWSSNVLTVYGLTMVTMLLLAGIYPAITLSSFKPILAIKGKSSKFGTKGNFRKVLVIIQFTFSIILIASTILIGKQLKYIREKNLGYDKQNVFSFWMRNIGDHYDAAVEELMKQPGITGVTESGTDIIDNSSGTTDLDWEGKRQDQQSFTIIQMPIERNFLQVMNIQLVEGLGFAGTPADSAHFILNETAVKEMGLKEPAVGSRLTVQGIKGEICGVVKDFYFQDMHQKIRPLLMQYNKYWRGKMYIRATGKNMPAALAAAGRIWKEYNPDYAFDYSFLDSEFNDLYRSDMHVGQLFNCFAIITILISCLGLFGLVTFTAEKKVKEIGVRKVLGAGVAQIVMLLSKDFLLLVIISGAIAFPVAWYSLNRFLQGYAYRTSLSWWVFLLAGAITLAIAMFTVSFKCVQAALANPVKSLRTE